MPKVSKPKSPKTTARKRTTSAVEPTQGRADLAWDTQKEHVRDARNHERPIAQRLLSGHDGTVLQYGPTRGYRPLLESALHVLACRGVQATLEQLIVTSGSQQGIDLIARVLVSPGDVVLVELPTFTGAIAAFKNVQAELIGASGATSLSVTKPCSSIHFSTSSPLISASMWPLISTQGESG